VEKIKKSVNIWRFGENMENVGGLLFIVHPVHVDLTCITYQTFYTP